MSESFKEALPWIGGALLVVVLVTMAVIWSLPDPDILPGIYEFQVL
jgi:hypothetical protein